MCSPSSFSLVLVLCHLNHLLYELLLYLSIITSLLEQNLQLLKEQHGTSLYTKIIIPADSKLLHDEAWKFTQEILQKYDYYYQQALP